MAQPTEPAGGPQVPGYSPETYYAAGWQPPAPRTEPLAVASVPTALLLGPVGTGLGAAALSRTRRDGTRGRGLALTGIVLGALVTVAWVVVLVLAQQAAGDRAPLAGDVAAPQSAHARQLVLGSCLADLPPAGEVADVDVVPCADEHHAQVVARTDFAADSVWPGQAAADARVARVCTAEVLGEGADADADALTLWVWAPSEASWDDGDRTGLCLAASDEPLTGSLLD